MTHIEPDGELAMQLKRISDQLGFLEKKIDQLLEQRSGGNRFGGDRQGGSAFPRRNFVKNYGRTRTAFYEGGERQGGYQGGGKGGYKGGSQGGFRDGNRQGGGFRDGNRQGGGFREGGFRGRAQGGGDFRRTGGSHKGGAARFDRKHTPRG